jgi:thiamine biosynthesis protein ThiI
MVTGESLGQVASQTLENIRAIDAAAQLPILRPLIGLDKQEVVAEAERIGTFSVSIEPHDDCCSFLQPPNPATYSSPEELAAQEAHFDVEAEVAKLVDCSEVLHIGQESKMTLGKGS